MFLSVTQKFGQGTMPLQMVDSVTQALAHEVLPAVPNVDNIRLENARVVTDLRHFASLRLDVA